MEKAEKAILIKQHEESLASLEYDHVSSVHAALQELKSAEETLKNEHGRELNALRGRMYSKSEADLQALIQVGFLFIFNIKKHV